MGTYILMVAVLGVVVIRDAQLLAIGPAEWAGRRLLPYTFCLLAYVLALDTTFSGLDSRGVITTLRMPVVWLASVGMHLVSWVACVWARKQSSRLAWTMALFPAPLLTLAVLLLSKTLTPLISQRHLRPVVFALLWSSGVAVLAHRIGPGAWPVRSQNWALEFGGWSNVLAIVLIPLHRITEAAARCRDVLDAYLRWD